MTRNLASLLVVALTLVAVTSFVAVAQDKPAGAQPPPAAGKDVTMVGKLMVVPTFMMEPGKHDPVKCGEAMKAGAPVALETPTGLILLGKGAKGMGEFAAMAHEEVEVKGKLFEKGGLKYIDVAAIAKKGAAKPAEMKKEEPKKIEPAKTEPKKEEPKKTEPAKTEPKKEEPKKPEQPKNK